MGGEDVDGPWLLGYAILHQVDGLGHAEDRFYAGYFFYFFGQGYIIGKNIFLKKLVGLYGDDQQVAIVPEFLTESLVSQVFGIVDRDRTGEIIAHFNPGSMIGHITSSE